MREEVIGGLRKLHDRNLHNFALSEEEYLEGSQTNARVI